MAYNPYMYLPQYSGYPQPNWSYQPQAVTSQPINGLVSVTGLEDAIAYQLPPNSSMPLFDGNRDLLYVKTTDAAGYPIIRTFKFEPIENVGPIEVKAEPVDYVPRSEFDALLSKVRELVESKMNGADDGK